MKGIINSHYDVPNPAHYDCEKMFDRDMAIFIERELPEIMQSTIQQDIINEPWSVTIGPGGEVLTENGKSK